MRQVWMRGKFQFRCPVKLAELLGREHLVGAAACQVQIFPDIAIKVSSRILFQLFLGMVFRQLSIRGIKHHQARTATAVRQHGKFSVILHRKCRVGIAAGHHNDLVALQRQGERRDLLRLHLHAGLLGKVFLLGLKGRERDHRFRLRLRSVRRKGRRLLPQLVQ